MDPKYAPVARSTVTSRLSKLCDEKKNEVKDILSSVLIMCRSPLTFGQIGKCVYILDALLTTYS